MITIEYIITMGILCLISWGFALYIYFSYKNSEKKEEITLYKFKDLQNYKVFC